MAKFRFTLSELQQGKSFPAGETHVLTISSVSRVRLVGMFFDLNKCFLLPKAIPGIKLMKSEYDKHPGARLLVVGHTDTSGDDAFNLDLSVERADAIAAYLTDDVAAWEAFFQESKPAQKRWGTREIQSMLTRLPDGGDPFLGDDGVDGVDGPKTRDAVKRFQKSLGLKEDGIAGPITRKALITKYMAIDGTTLPKGVKLTTHGCGENFPVDDTGDGVRDPDNRRVEIFFFDGDIQPLPPGKTSKKGSAEYPQWRDQVVENVDVSAVGVELDAVLPPQKDFEEEDGPILLADASGSLPPKTTATDAGGGLLAAPAEKHLTFTMGPIVPPTITHDHGFLGAGPGRTVLDNSFKRSANAEDLRLLIKWRAMLRGAQLLRSDLLDATQAYEHYHFGKGAPFVFSYERFVSQDPSGGKVLESMIADTRADAIRVEDGKTISTPKQDSIDQFAMQSQVVIVGGRKNRFPYPQTENWQKAIGGHAIWVEAAVTVDIRPSLNKRNFHVDLILHADDMYNFDPDKADIATGTPDAENGRFQVSSLADEFLSTSDLKRTITFSVPLAPVADPTLQPADQRVDGGSIPTPAPVPGVTPPSGPPPKK